MLKPRRTQSDREVRSALGSAQYVANPAVESRGAGREAVRVAQILRCGDRPTVDALPEKWLFEALHASAHRARRFSGRAGRGASTWFERWRLIRDYLVDRNLGLVFSTLSRFESAVADREELRSEGLLALVRAVHGFNPWMGIRFSTYACHAIRRSLLLAAKKAARRRTFYPDPRYTWTEDPAHGDRWPSLAADRLRKMIVENQGDLTAREAIVLDWRFPLGGGSARTLGEIGEHLGLSKERVRQIQESAIDKLRTILRADPALQ